MNSLQSGTFHAAEAFRQLKKTDKAIDLYEKVRTDWPASQFATQSTLVGDASGESTGGQCPSFQAVQRIKEQ